MHKKLFIVLALAGGLFLSPGSNSNSQAQPVIPDRDVLNSIVQDQVPEQKLQRPPKQADKKQMKDLEKAVKQNLGSAEFLMQVARDAGASPKTLQEMEKMSVGFMKAFLSAVAPEMLEQNAAPTPPPAKPRPPKAVPGQQQKPAPARPMPPEARPVPNCPYLDAMPMKPGQPPQAARPKTQPQVAPRQPQPQQPQGIIITAPDGTQWLVTPQTQQPMPKPAPVKPAPPKPQAPVKKAPVQPAWPAPQAPGFMQNQAPQAPSAVPQQQAPEEVIVIEEDVVSDMPLWPTKEQLGNEGVLKYLQRRSGQQQ